MRTWLAQDAERRFDEMLDACLTDGPQLVQQNGVNAAVLLTVDEWHRLSNAKLGTWNKVLLADEPRADIPLPDRHGTVGRRMPDLE